ncbi:MAG: ribonuclease R [Pseudomonadota bacterium]|nr:ribonuclease R [Pseudomonadota bacterium]
MSRQKSILKKVDPFAERESQKYDNPIPSREYIIQQLTQIGKPLTLKKIAHLLTITDDERFEALRRRLRAMIRDGQLVRNRRNGYGLAKKMDLVRGRVIAHADGFGFLVPDEGGTDLFLPEKEMRSLFHGDRILANVIGIDHRGRREGALVEVLERNTQEIVGRFMYKRGKGIAFVEADNPRIHHNIIIQRKKTAKAKQGQIVVARVLEQPTPHNPPIGEIIEIMGDQRAPGMEVDIAIRAHELPQKWPDAVIEEIAPLTPEIAADSIAQREDMRTIPFVTIDGEDARDFDDAVYCQPRGRGWLLYVAIADVSAYVKPGTALDQEAQNRGNSVYFPNRVIPMLPEILSNELCSLKPHVDRCSIVCELAIDMYGRIRRTRFHEAVIQSQARLTYTQVAAVLANQNADFAYPELLTPIHNLYALYQLLLKRRKKRGAIEIETIEPCIIFDEQQKIERIVGLQRNEAHKLVEEMMLAANVATAQWLEARQLPFLYRVHDGPNTEKLAGLRQFLNELGLRLGGKAKPQAKHYAQLVENIQTRPDAHLIQTVLLRSLQMAIYSPENKGHFGLAYEQYTHFTSPIRRYPDLLVHRAIRHGLQQKTADKFYLATEQLHLLGEHCSMTERRADEATREAISWLKCEYMRDKVGEDYEGAVTGVAPFGLFVELEGIFVEGLVHVTALTNDYYHFDPIGHRLWGEHSGNVYRLSDRLRVKVVRVDLEDKKIDFELA